MAEYGIHHVISNFSKPSIFEVIGHDNLASSLRAAFLHLFKVLAENNPMRYGLIYRNFDELYVLVDSIFQYLHLRLKGGLFTETFYSLKRIPDPRSLNVSRRKVALWVICAVVYPYLQRQLEEVYKNMRDDHSRGSLASKGTKNKLALLYLKVYPVYHFLSETSVLCYYLAYALGKSSYHSPLMHLTSTTLTHLTMIDLSDDAWKQHIPKEQHKKLSNTIWNLVNVFIGGITLSISVGSFLTQFLNWWYSREGNTTNLTPLPVPPPPKKWPCDIPVDICFICKKSRSNDTALASSGFVFCYPCIFKYVEVNRECPITGYKSSLNQLIKLYHQE
ncbi:peroxisome assembly protein 12 [Parasteatoda tepidariorum]|uniref:peroxisome assembly protein 12 n=1 Tax=Parasteatoda tepidariorum TaxID=114398 RepID=UPI001C724DF6|nr:peroxisome assembly protein 12 [Parasteatoda tepidariorum]